MSVPVSEGRHQIRQYRVRLRQRLAACIVCKLRLYDTLRPVFAMPAGPRTGVLLQWGREF
jgi:hypothetical protein